MCLHTLKLLWLFKGNEKYDQCCEIHGRCYEGNEFGKGMYILLSYDENLGNKSIKLFRYLI